METFELLEELEETPPVDYTEEEIDLAAFELWREASVPEVPEDPA